MLVFKVAQDNSCLFLPDSVVSSHPFPSSILSCEVGLAEKRLAQLKFPTGLKEKKR